jgi:hypothetical protein
VPGSCFSRWPGLPCICRMQSPEHRFRRPRADLPKRGRAQGVTAKAESRGASSGARQLAELGNEGIGEDMNRLHRRVRRVLDRGRSCRVIPACRWNLKSRSSTAAGTCPTCEPDEWRTDSGLLDDPFALAARDAPPSSLLFLPSCQRSYWPRLKSRTRLPASLAIPTVVSRSILRHFGCQASVDQRRERLYSLGSDRTSGGAGLP